MPILRRLALAPLALAIALPLAGCATDTISMTEPEEQVSEPVSPTFSSEVDDQGADGAEAQATSDDLSGVWSEPADDDGYRQVVEVAGETVAVYEVRGGGDEQTRDLIWAGTFPPADEQNTIVSVADRDQMTGERALDQDELEFSRPSDLSHLSYEAPGSDGEQHLWQPERVERG